jgi:ABC-2 type transport system ATP-binding protein
VLEVHHVSKRFGDLVALDDVSLSVERGQIVGFLGPNGAGKSTTMRAVMGLIAVDSGAIAWNGAPVSGDVRRRFGYMPAERGMYPKMTVGEQIDYFARVAGLDRDAARRATRRWMERLDIAARAADEVQALSSGNQQRVQLAIALTHDPDVLILDEPFSGLDPVAVENMKAILVERVDAGTAVLFSSHQLDLVGEVSRDVVIIDRGRVVMSGDVTELRERSPRREATVRFAADTSWTPSDPAVTVVERSGRLVRVQVDGAVDPARLLADAAVTGQVVEFSFAPPDLSEVFLDAVGRGPEVLR